MIIMVMMIVMTMIIESFRFWDEYDYEYEILSVLSSALA